MLDVTLRLHVPNMGTHRGICSLQMVYIGTQVPSIPLVEGGIQVHIITYAQVCILTVYTTLHIQCDTKYVITLLAQSMHRVFTNIISTYRYAHATIQVYQVLQVMYIGTQVPSIPLVEGGIQVHQVPYGHLRIVVLHLLHTSTHCVVHIYTLCIYLHTLVNMLSHC